MNFENAYTRFKNCIQRVVRFFMPVTSLMTVGVVGYISYVYLFDYIPLLEKFVKYNAHDYSEFEVRLL